MLLSFKNINKTKTIFKAVFIFSFFAIATSACVRSLHSSNKEITKQTTENMKYNPLTPEEEQVILHKGTERPFTGELLNIDEEGTYHCKRCDAPLYRSEDKFDARCGWPSFDDEIPNAVKREVDADGFRTEILCANCGAHLGHVFLGEGFTDKNTRHCVNSISMKFIHRSKENMEIAYLASGCFWGTQYHLMRLPGVIETKVGYMGGHVDSPSYREVCTGTTGHVEVTQVKFDNSKVDYETLLKLYFETHDFTQVGGQGPDIGEQYRSVIFYNDDKQKELAEKLIQVLETKDYKVATELTSAKNHVFWEAEEYHQEYYDKNNGTPYCHIYRKVF